MATAKARDDVKACRCKPKSTGALSEEEQQILEADSIFLELIVAGNVSGAEQKINEGQEVNVGDETGESSCHKAMRVADPSMLKMLVKHGGFVDYSDSYGNRPVNVAMQMGEAMEPHIAYLLSLKDSKGELVVNLKALNFKTGNTLVHDAAWVGNTAACQALLNTGAFTEMLETTNKQGQTAMHIAAFRAPKTLVTALVDAGADSNAHEKNGRRLSKETPEMMAQAMGREDTAQYLRDLNTAVNAVKFGARMKMGARKAENESSVAA